MGFQHGLSGMNAASKNLDVIGNNIANANTTGFKASRAQFSEIFGSALGSVSGIGIGQGVSVAAVDQNFGQGGTTATGNNLDVAINGNGFFQLQMPDQSLAYTRAGSFKVDKDGFLVNHQGAKVMGYETDPISGTQLASIGPITLPVNDGVPGKVTDQIAIGVNLDTRAATFTGTLPDRTYSSAQSLYNSQGRPIDLTLYYSKTDANEWAVHASFDDGTGPQTVALATLAFGNDGRLTSTTPAAVSLTFKDADGTTDATASIDFSKTTQLSSGFAVNQLSQTGYAPGFLNGVTIGADGNVQARYSNGVTLSQGRLALANFNNLNGLSSTIGGNWVATPRSGVPIMGAASVGNFGTLQAGSLEDSNVDLTAELVNMMTAQRSYQANAQTLKTQDQVMSTLVNLR